MIHVDMVDLVVWVPLVIVGGIGIVGVIKCMKQK